MIADMHVHSNYSRDGKSSVKKILRAAVEKRLNALAITDHDTVNGSLEAIDITKEEHMKITIIPGIEVSTRDGHLLVYGIKKDIDPGMKIIETIKLAKKYQAVTAIAHPFQFYRHGCMKFWVAKQVDAIEVLNAKYIVGICNWLSKAMAKIYGKPGIAGSDAHTADEVGRAVTVIDISARTYPTYSTSADMILKTILYGNTSVRGRRQSLSSWPKINRKLSREE